MYVPHYNLRLWCGSADLSGPSFAIVWMPGRKWKGLNIVSKTYLDINSIRSLLMRLCLTMWCPIKTWVQWNAKTWGFGDHHYYYLLYLCHGTFFDLRSSFVLNLLLSVVKLNFCSFVLSQSSMLLCRPFRVLGSQSAFWYSKSSSFPAPPKRNKSAYLWYMKDMLPALKKEYPSYKNTGNILWW